MDFCLLTPQFFLVKLQVVGLQPNNGIMDFFTTFSNLMMEKNTYFAEHLLINAHAVIKNLFKVQYHKGSSQLFQYLYVTLHMCVHFVHFNDMKINRWLHLSNSLLEISLHYNLFKFKNNQYFFYVSLTMFKHKNNYLCSYLILTLVQS